MTTRQKIAILVLMLCAFLIVGQLYLTLPLLPDIAKTYGVDSTTATLVGSAFGLAYAAGFLVSGPLADYFGRVSVLFYGMLATAAATFLVALAPSFSWLVGFRVVQGVCAASFPPAALALIAERLPENKRPLGISLISMAFLSAAPLAQLIGAQQAERGMTGLMLVIAPCYLVLGMIFLLIFRQRPPAEVKPQTPVERNRHEIAALFTDAGMVGTWLAAATVFFGFVGFYASVQVFQHDLGLNTQTVRLLGLPTILLTLLASRLTRRFGAPMTAMFGLLLMVIAMGLAALSHAYLIFIASAMLSAGVAFALPGLIGTVAARTNRHNRGFGMAVYSFTLFIGASIAQPIIIKFQYLGLTTLCLSAAICLTIGLVALQFARHPTRERNPA